MRNTPQERRQWVVQQMQQGWRYLRSGWRPQAIAAAFFLLTAVIIGSILLANRSTFAEYRRQMRPVWLLYALALVVAIFVLSAGVWHLLVARLAGYNSWRRNLKNWGYAGLAKRLPGPVWYIGSRALLYEEQGLNKRMTSLLSALELVLILLSGITTFLLTLPFWVLPEAVSARLSASWFLLILLPLCILLVHPRFLEALWHKVSRQLVPRRLLWRDTISWLFYYVFIWLIGAGVLFSVINVFQPLPVSELIPVAGMWVIANTISLAGTLTLTGVGLREISLVLLLSQLVPAPVAVLIAIVVRVLWMGGDLLGALLSLLL